MHLVQLLLPLYDHTGRSFDPAHYARIRQTLTEGFGGLTAYTRAPAAGLWKDEEQIVRDDVVVYEVMVQELDRDWWAVYREELMVRAQAVEVL
ncbi:hypothetical protein Dgeo_1335 [Deinococcus geothermalis DSM 11300]|uniref:Uncharacterized protein n=2 Tax=Deinococcus geothermalis TaxID=68909 RepID=Q1IYQ3_DEIGD|nr:hypothetical protein Dgeo_1335 [Deinococcus geothermalis DSM 11300]